jgi:hypothetical protein
MSIVVRFAPESVTTQQYDQAVERVNQELGEELPDGCELHVAFIGPDGNVRVSEIWDSQEQLEAFGQRLMPLLAELGIEPGEPEVLQVHAIERR